MSNYNPTECKESNKLYGIYLCRLNGGVPCALHKGEKCYMQVSDEAVARLANVFKKEEETG